MKSSNETTSTNDNLNVWKEVYQDGKYLRFEYDINLEKRTNFIKKLKRI